MTKLNLLYILYIYSRQGGKGVNIFIDNKSGAPIYDSDLFTDQGADYRR